MPRVADFNALKATLEAAQGNLSAHLRKLEEAGSLTVEKGVLGRNPHTQARLTDAGRRAFARHLESMSALLGRSTGGESGRTYAPPVLRRRSSAIRLAARRNSKA